MCACNFQATWTEIAVPDEALLGKIRAGLAKIKVFVSDPC